MPPVLPDSLARLLSLLRPAFTAPAFDVFCWLVHGFIGRIGEHTITGVWQAARLAGVSHHSRAHEFFSRRRWSADELGLRLADLIVARFVAKDAPIRVAVDETLFPRSGTKVFACSWHFDPEVKLGRSGKRIRRGNSFVCLGILVALPVLGRRVVYLPLLFRLWREGASQTRPEQAIELIAMLANRFAERRIELLADSYYANRKLATLPENVSACVRLRANAALYAPPPPRPAGRPGRPRKKGERLGSPAEVASDPATRWRRVRVRRADGSARRVEAVVLGCLWFNVLGERRLRVVLCRGLGRTPEEVVAVLSTDPQAPRGRDPLPLPRAVGDRGRLPGREV